jgi:hypothetical protein
VRVQRFGNCHVAQPGAGAFGSSAILRLGVLNWVSSIRS